MAPRIRFVFLSLLATAKVHSDLSSCWLAPINLGSCGGRLSSFRRGCSHSLFVARACGIAPSTSDWETAATCRQCETSRGSGSGRMLLHRGFL